MDEEQRAAGIFAEVQSDDQSRWPGELRWDRSRGDFPYLVVHLAYDSICVTLPRTSSTEQYRFYYENWAKELNSEIKSGFRDSKWTTVPDGLIWKSLWKTLYKATPYTAMLVQYD